MVTATQRAVKSRFTDLCDEPIDHLLAPIKGFPDKPLISLDKAVKPISGFFDEIEAYVSLAQYNCKNPTDGLTPEESASIQLYTMQYSNGPSLYELLNRSLRAENRAELIPWFSYLKLFLTALHKLPSQSITVWRGVRNVDLSSHYMIGSEFAWWGVSSCTTNIEVLESNKLLGKTGPRTLFSIECVNGKSIASHSYFKDSEKEIILMPGSYFEVIGQLNPTHELHIIQLKETKPSITLVSSPIIESVNTKSASKVNVSSTLFRPTPKMIAEPTSSQVVSHNIPSKPNTKWKQYGITVAGGNGYGRELNQLSHPEGIFVDDDQTIYIADCRNNRIVEWVCNAKNGRIVAGGHGKGNQSNQLHWPTDVVIDQRTNSFIIAERENRQVVQWSRQNNTRERIIVSDIRSYGLTVDKKGYLYVSDTERHEVRRWKIGDESGTLVAGGNGQGDNLNQLNVPTHMFLDQDNSLFISDCENHRVMKWMKDAKEGVVVAGGNGPENSLVQLSFPDGVIVDQFAQIYVADSENHRVMCWCKEATEGAIIVGGNTKGKASNQLHCPASLSFDRQGNLYVVDFLNHRIQKFEIDLD